MGAEIKGLSIYGYPSCPFCSRVLRAVDALGLEIEFRNTMQNAEYHGELANALGRTTVPVLRIEGEDGQVKWLPESADIIVHLEELAERAN